MATEKSQAGLQLLNSNENTEAFIELNLRIQKGVGFRQHDKLGDFTPLTISSVIGHGHLLSQKSIGCNPTGGKRHAKSVFLFPQVLLYFLL